MTLLKQNSSYVDGTNPRGVANGGFGVDTNTAYAYLTGGTTSTGAIQQVGPGTAGQIIKSSGSAALPTLVDNKSATAFQLITTQTASNSPTIEFTGLSSTYFVYKIFIYALVPATNTVMLAMRMSTNNGSSYFSGASDYKYAVRAYSETTSTLNTKNSTAATFGALTPDLTNNAAANSTQLEITLVNPSAAIAYNGAICQGRYANSSTNFNLTYAEMSLTQNVDVDAIQLLMSSGNITSGVFKLYGLLA